MRKLIDHKVSGCNEAIDIKVMDDPGAGGASHHYCIYVPHDGFNEELNAPIQLHIQFQNGPIKESGVNGITQEALLAVCIDRLRSFQAGPFACRENELALTKLQEGQMWLHKRTTDRMNRGVEGTHEK